MVNKSLRNYSAEQVKALCDMYKVVPQSYEFKGGTTVPIAQALDAGLVFINWRGELAEPTVPQFTLARDMYGIDPEVMANTFYRSFSTVLEKSRFELFVDQIIHYASTYGMIAEGKKPLNLVPLQDIVIPDVDLSKVKVTVIQIATDGQIVNHINETLASVKKPSGRIVENVKLLLEFCDLPLEDIQSFELLTLAMDYFHEVPGNPKMFLRYLIYKMTGDTMIVKSRRKVVALRQAVSEDYHHTAYEMLSKADKVGLASIFLRYKPLFLAFKADPKCVPIINHLRRLADTYHQPLSPVTLQNYVALVKRGNLEAAHKLREKFDNRDIITVLNAIGVALNTEAGSPRIFNIRTGRSYCLAEGGKALNETEAGLLSAEYSQLMYILSGRLASTVADKFFYIPYEIDYAAPTTEKQFLNNIPYGTRINLPDGGMTVGVSWVNGNGQHDIHTDLDLHAFTAHEHFGWNSSYTDGKKVIYSGDMTNAPAPKGAAEAFYLEGVQDTTPVVFTLQKFAGMKGQKFKLYFSSTPPATGTYNRYDNPYTMDPNELLMAPIPLNFGDDYGMTLGFLSGGQFVIYGGNLSNSIVPRGDFAKYLEAMDFRYDHALSMGVLLTRAGAKVITSKTDCEYLTSQETPFVDLSPEALTPSTLLDIVDGK